MLAFADTAADGIGRSVPRPGKGLASFATARRSKPPFSAMSLPRSEVTPRSSDASHPPIGDKNFADTPSSELETEKRLHAEQIGLSEEHIEEDMRQHTHAPWHQPQGSRLHRALAKFNPIANDLNVVSLHATSTQADEANELDVLNTQLQSLGRDPINSPPLLATCQKGLTGHGKGTAGAWAVNSSLQILSSGIVPANPTIDDVDPVFEKLDMNICFPAESVQTQGVPVISVTGLGFGQKGAQVLLVHPDRLWAIAGPGIGKEAYGIYLTKMRKRKTLGDRAFADAIYKGNMVRIKEKGPFE